MGSVPIAYVSATQCPSCARLLEIFSRLKLDVRVIDVDKTFVEGLHSVPTVVVDSRVMVGTDVFVWLQEFESSLPLDEYATVMGAEDETFAAF